METEILEIKALIDQLRVLDERYLVFGADGHQYLVGPALSQAEIEAFERQHDIVLPADYRLYLQLVGNGNGLDYYEGKFGDLAFEVGPGERSGAGPDYGLYPLAETVQGDKVSEPFPFEEMVELPPGPPYTITHNVPGALEISTGGCLYRTHLIVSGPQRGMIWQSWDITAFWPTNVTFAQWMREWVEDHIQVFANKPLFDRLKEGMTKDEVIAATGEGWEERELGGGRLFENDRLRAQLTLDEQGVVTAVRSFFWKIRVTPDDW